MIQTPEKNMFVNGFKIRYLEFDRRSNKEIDDRVTDHILFIHGLGSSADRWGDIPEALSKSHHTLAIDLIGFGKSDTPATVDYNINFFRQFILEFMKKVGIDDGKTSLVGHSLGGYIAAEFAIENPTLVARLVLIDSSGLLKGPTPLLEQYLHASLFPSYDNVKSVFQQMMFNPTALLPILVDYFVMRINQPNAKYSFRSAFENSTRTQIGTDRLEQLDSMPTLIVWGRHDMVIPIEYLELFRQMLTNASIEIIENTGHAPFSEKPAVVYEVIRDFVA